MRILQVGPIPPEIGGQTAGGVATHLWSLATYLNTQGHTVGVLGGNYYVAEAQPEIKEGIRLYGLLGLGRSLRTGYSLCPSFWLKLLRTKIHFRSLMSWKAVLSGLLNYHRVIQDFKPDIIHVHHLEYRFPFVQYLVEDRIPALTTVHSTSFLEFSPFKGFDARKEFIYRNLQLAQRIIFVSQFLRNRFETYFGRISEDKDIYIVTNPVDGSTYYPISKEAARVELGLAGDLSLILFVGKLIPQKGLDILIKAANLLQCNGLDFQVLVVGSGPQRAELAGLVQQLELDDRLRFEGMKTQQELFLYYNAADLFVLPSPMESFGLVFVEAMLCGCPVLGRAEVLNEILPSERCGERILDASPEVWTERIEEALGRSWSKAEIHKASQGYTWDSLGDEFLKIYEEIKE